MNFPWPSRREEYGAESAEIVAWKESWTEQNLDFVNEHCEQPGAVALKMMRDFRDTTSYHEFWVERGFSGVFFVAMQQIHEQEERARTDLPHVSWRLIPPTHAMAVVIVRD